MTDLQISMALAKAIGWREDQMHVNGHILTGHTLMIQRDDSCFARPFDSKDPENAFRVAEKFDCFPMTKRNEPGWFCFDDVNGYSGFTAEGDTPQKAIAMAVINGVKK
jgi:hypothetical protein